MLNWKNTAMFSTNLFIIQPKYVGQKFCVFKDYGFTNRFAEYGLRSLCMINVGVRILLLSNLAEAVIYYRIHVHVKR